MSKTALHLGWEFPPNHHGGLGVACEGLVDGLVNHGINVILITPHGTSRTDRACRIVSVADAMKTLNVDSLLHPYLTSTEYDEQRARNPRAHLYGATIFAEVERYAHIVAQLAHSYQFNVIHAHDWMAFPAALRLKHESGKPLVVHLHSTELDRTGGNSVNDHVYNIERTGMHLADKVVAVSNATRQKIIEHYSVDHNKINVMHNALPLHYRATPRTSTPPRFTNDRIVLFVGRLTLQKGPDYFVHLAHRVLHHRRDVSFVVAGTGDMQYRLIEQAAELGISDKVTFTGFMQTDDVKKLYQLADLLVMPSVAEPFGLAALEAMSLGTPVLIDKRAGVTEVVKHCLKSDFWDIDAMASKVLAVLDHPALQRELASNAHRETHNLSWESTATSCVQLYHTLTT